jgi:hypothetical protein
VPFVTLGVAYQQALRHYIEEGLAGNITAAQYPADGEGRIITVDQAAAEPIRFATFNASLNRNTDDSADFAEPPGNLRADYVLPSTDLTIVDGRVFWPVSDDPLLALVGTFPLASSDHHLVWADVQLGQR